MTRACPALLLSLLLLLSRAAACAREEVELDLPPPSPPAVSAPSEQDLTLTAGERVEEGYPMPGPERRRGEAAVALNATCEACHKDEADEWRRSRHREANTNAAYRAAFAVEPSAFCTGCHAPEADLANPKANANVNTNINTGTNKNKNTKIPERAVSELGVGCVTCHITEEGVVLAGTASSAGAAPHPLRRSAEFTKAGACAGCHEFRFPGATGDDDGHFMQTTAREHASSPGADKPCADCHMPIVSGRRSHAFTAVRDPAWLRENLRATASLSADNRLRVTLTQPDPGHAFPTGDLFRRLEIGCEMRDAAGKVIQREARHLARHFDILPGRPGRILTRDDRVFAEPSVVE
ncbi:MAG TPA: multiheme c-type cytochrome, partial [Polyangiaceae bacterium]|nr:multiheme c-type cytochrome [Polyangiaceae bacterium]